MTETTISVLVERLEGVKEHLSEKLDRIEKQTVKTNSRVSSLERWRSYTIGALSILSAIVIPVLLIILGGWFD